MADTRRRCRDRGASIVEFAFIAPVMALIVMGVLDLGRAYRMQIQLEAAASEGAAHAQLYPNDVVCDGPDPIPDRTDITDRVLAEEPGLASFTDLAIAVYGEDASGDLVVPVSGCGGSTVSSGERVRVEIRATFDVVTPLVERAVGSTITVEGSSEIEVQG